MLAVHHVCRLATVEDIEKSAPLWGQDRPLFDSDVWDRMPDLLENLLQNELVRLAYIEAHPGESRDCLVEFHLFIQSIWTRLVPTARPCRMPFFGLFSSTENRFYRPKASERSTRNANCT